ncbi:nuclear transport factor 2 family protein [Pseudonocardia halophobica]|uniref:nuclear transport factor 2 family protein n=1 Tax=Pseudonocardia halophobica TaxID=29401 RepID=UPI003D8DEE9D
MAATPSTENERIVLEFLGLWEKRDVSLLLPFFTPTGSYIDTPLPPRHGIDEIKAYIEAVFGGFSVRIETLKIASAGDLVFTERIDYLGAEGKPEVALPVAGVMEMKDGKIDQWREYLDLATAEEGLGIKMK